MTKNTFSKQDIRSMITNSFIQGKPIAFSFSDLRFPFGFTRMDGKDILLLQLISNKSEEQIQTAPDNEIHEKIKAWCKEQNIGCFYEIQRDMYYFR